MSRTQSYRVMQAIWESCPDGLMQSIAAAIVLEQPGADEICERWRQFFMDTYGDVPENFSEMLNNPWQTVYAGDDDDPADWWKKV